MESLKEQIKHETELLRLLWVTAIAAIGGSLSLLLGEQTSIHILLAGVGFIAILILVSMIVRQETVIRRLLRHLRDKEQQA